METHGIHTGSNLKEITCGDCGHIYVVEKENRSGTCTACGNIAYLSGAGELAELVARRVLPRIREARTDPLAPFRSPPDGKAVERLRTKYQVEWQLWAALTQNFRDPVHHMAFLTRMLAENRLEQAAERYREHRSVMLLLEDSRWQAEIADLMLSRIEALSLARMPNARGDYGFDVPDFLRLLPYNSYIYKCVYLATGLFFVMKLLHLWP